RTGRPAAYFAQFVKPCLADLDSRRSKSTPYRRRRTCIRPTVVSVESPGQRRLYENQKHPDTSRFLTAIHAGGELRSRAGPSISGAGDSAACRGAADAFGVCVSG